LSGKTISGCSGVLAIGPDTLEADRWKTRWTMADRVAAETLGIARQIIAEIEPGEHLADHDMRLWLHERQVFKRAGTVRQPRGVPLVDRRAALSAMRAFDLDRRLVDNRRSLRVAEAPFVDI